jgi:hypothetical protein
MRNAIVVLALAAGACFLAGADEPEKSEWKDLFNGKDLTGWTESNFGSSANTVVEDGKIVIQMAERLSGITYRDEDKLPKINYEIELEARRIDGTDFFVGLTFPVTDSHASLILGGWGGTVCGISSIDDEDASENATRKVIKFKKGQWYKVKLRVEKNRIQAWLDDEPIIDADTAGKKIDVRPEIAASKPLGLATFATTAEVKSIRIKELKSPRPADHK